MRWLHDYPIVRMPRMKLKYAVNLRMYRHGIYQMNDPWGYPHGMYAQIRVAENYWPMIGLN